MTFCFINFFFYFTINDEGLVSQQLVALNMKTEFGKKRIKNNEQKSK